MSAFQPLDLDKWRHAVPHGQTLDVEEYEVAALELRKCRSFRADLNHKLTLIVRAAGGHGRAGIRNTAQRLRVCRQTLSRWLRFEATPRTRDLFLRIDAAYSDAVDLLAREQAKLAARNGKRRRK